MVSLILLALLIAVTSGVISCLLKKFDIVHIVVLALSVDTVVYAGISFVLYSIRKYTIERSLFVALGLFAILFVVLLFIGKRISYSFSLQKSVIPVALIIIFTVVSIFVVKSGYYGAYDKIGAEQSKAMLLKDEYYIYGLSDNDYYENIYTEEELEEVKSLLEPLDSKQKSANTAIASVMALIGRVFGYKSMIYTYVYMFSLIIFVTYIICFEYIKKYGLTCGISSGVTLIASLMMIFTFAQKDTVISWNELHQIDRISNETSAYVIDKDILNEMYIPIKCMTMGYVVPEISDTESDENRFFDIQTNTLKDCSNFNIITSNNRFDDEYIEGLMLSKAYSGDFSIYRNNWKYYYDGNFENIDKTSNYHMIFVVIAGIFALAYAVSSIYSYISNKDIDVVITGMISINIYAIIYTLIGVIQIHNFDKYSGSIFLRNVNIATMLSIFISCLLFIIIDVLRRLHIKDNDTKTECDIKLNYKVNRLSVGVIVGSICVIVIVVMCSGVTSYICTGKYGNIQQACISFITGNVTDMDNTIINNMSFMDMVKSAWLVFVGSFLDISHMMYAICLMAINFSTLIGIVVYIIMRNNIEKINIIVSIVVAVVAIGATVIASNKVNTYKGVYNWNDVDTYLSNVKSTDVIAYDESVDKTLVGIITSLRNTQTVQYSESSYNIDNGYNVYLLLKDVEEQVGILGNQIYYITSNVIDITNTEFMMYNSYESYQYNMGIYQKYTISNKNDNVCVYKIDKNVSKGSNE